MEDKRVLKVGPVTQSASALFIDPGRRQLYGELTICWFTRWHGILPRPITRAVSSKAGFYSVSLTVVNVENQRVMGVKGGEAHGQPDFFWVTKHQSEARGPFAETFWKRKWRCSLLSCQQGWVLTSGRLPCEEMWFCAGPLLLWLPSTTWEILILKNYLLFEILIWCSGFIC